jgi:YD repeat-containing protein
LSFTALSPDIRNQPLFARFFFTSGQGVTSNWNPYGELTASSIDLGGTTRTLSYQYDADGNRTRVTHPDSVAFVYSYDGLDRPGSITDSTYAAGYGYRSYGTNGAELG